MNFFEYIEEAESYLYNEDHLATTQIRAYHTQNPIACDVYKNPKTIKKMMWYLRGIIMPNGDLYVVDYEYTDKGTIIHVDLSQWLKKNVPSYKCDYHGEQDVAKYLNEILTVQRVNDTDAFELSESYAPSDFEFPHDPIRHKEMQDLFNKYKTAFKKKNPQFTLEYKFA